MYKFRWGKSAKKKNKKQPFTIRFIYDYSTVDKSFDKCVYINICIIWYGSFILLLMNLLHTFKQCLSCQGFLTPHFLISLFLVADSKLYSHIDSDKFLKNLCSLPLCSTTFLLQLSILSFTFWHLDFIFIQENIPSINTKQS